MFHRFERSLRAELDPNRSSARSNRSAAGLSATPFSGALSSAAHQARNRDERGRELFARLESSLGVRERVRYPELSHAIVGAAIEVHRHLGPGKLESTYQRALDEELTLRRIAHRGQVPVALRYKGRDVGSFVLDFIVDDKVVLELKAVERQHAVHKAQVLSYLHATSLRLGLLINFNVPVLWRGVERVVL
jgi:GxxExxY protein